MYIYIYVYIYVRLTRVRVQVLESKGKVVLTLAKPPRHSTFDEVKEWPALHFGSGNIYINIYIYIYIREMEKLRAR